MTVFTADAVSHTVSHLQGQTPYHAGVTWHRGDSSVDTITHNLFMKGWIQAGKTTTRLILHSQSKSPVTAMSATSIRPTSSQSAYKTSNYKYIQDRRFFTFSFIHIVFNLLFTSLYRSVTRVLDLKHLHSRQRFLSNWLQFISVKFRFLCRLFICLFML